MPTVLLHPRSRSPPCSSLHTSPTRPFTPLVMLGVADVVPRRRVCLCVSVWSVWSVCLQEQLRLLGIPVADVRVMVNAIDDLKRQHASGGAAPVFESKPPAEVEVRCPRSATHALSHTRVLSQPLSAYTHTHTARANKPQSKALLAQPLSLSCS